MSTFIPFQYTIGLAVSIGALTLTVLIPFYSRTYSRTL